MHPVITLRDLRPLDILVLRDLVRFGVLADDQIERRYGGDRSLAASRLELLRMGGFVEPWPSYVQDTSAYSATTRGTRTARCGLRRHKPSLDHLRHDIAVVDLADYLFATDPSADFRTEREAYRILGGTRRWQDPDFASVRAHKPDGLLLTGRKRLAIELEHTAKSEQKYGEICRWFALAVRLDGVRWYVDDPRIGDLINRVNVQHGYGLDIGVEILPFPPGVRVRSWAHA